VHTRLGARLGPVLPHSMRITGRVADWESWTRMRFPESGDYVFPKGLATVHIDRDAADSGRPRDAALAGHHPDRHRLSTAMTFVMRGSGQRA
jgi:hypothetical protein